MSKRNRLACVSSPTRRAGLAAAALTALGILVSGATDARAASSCVGQFQTSQLYPWPGGVSFSPALRPSDDYSQARTQAFISGLQQGGVTVNDTSPFAMQVVFSFLPGRSANTDKTEVYPDLQWNSAQGRSSNLVRPGLVGQILNLTIIITDNSAYRQMWIGTMQCTIRSADTTVLAHDVGENLGRTLAASMRGR